MKNGRMDGWTDGKSGVGIFVPVFVSIFVSISIEMLVLEAHVLGYSYSVTRTARRGKAATPSGCETRPAPVAPAGSSRSRRGSNETSEASDIKGPIRGSASAQALTKVNAEQTSKVRDVEPTR